MHKELRAIHDHMLKLGKAALAHANYHACFHSFEGEMWEELSVLQAGHAAEIFIKARIAQELMMVVSLIIDSKSRINDVAMLTSSKKNYFAFNYDGCPVNFYRVNNSFS
jgi:hypothetical protein